MKKQPRDKPWAERWLDGVTESSMTQRKLSTVLANGGIAALKAAAKKRGIHLLQLTDDRGVELVAASKHAFKILR